MTIAKMEKTMSVAEMEKMVTWHVTDCYICKTLYFHKTLFVSHIPDLHLPSFEWPSSLDMISNNDGHSTLARGGVPFAK